MNDLRFGLRMLSRSRTSSLAIVLLLALGTGVGTVIFSLFDAVVLRPLPVKHPEELVRMVQRFPRIGTRSSFRYATYEALRDRATGLSTVFGEAGDYLRFTLTEPGPSEQVIVYGVTPEYFEALGVEARYGRTLSRADASDTRGLPPVVLSYGFWSRRFGGDRRVIGQTLAVNGQRFVMVGILPRDFNGLAADTGPDLRIPLRAFPLLGNKQADWDLQLAARLQPGVTRTRAESQLVGLWLTLADETIATDKEMADWSRRYRVAFDPLDKGYSTLRDRFGNVLEWLMASALLLALLVCANVAGLLAARASARRHEVAVRLAVGATRVRLIRQMLAENGLLAAVGMAGGISIAFVVTPLLARALPPIRQLDSSLLPLTVDVHVNSRVLLFSFGLALLTMLFFTVAPAVAACRTGLDTVLRGARSSRGGRGRQALITLQIALCTFLLCGAGLQVRAFRKLHDQNPGFDRDRVATFTLNLSANRAQSEASFLRAFTDRVRQLPAVASVAVSGRGVLRDRGIAATVAPTGHVPTQADFLNTDFHTVSPEYFETMGIPILQGRSLMLEDTPAPKPAPPMRVVVNQTFARRFFPDTNPLGQHFGRGMEKPVGADFEIVGVCGDAKYRSMREPLKPIFYEVGSDYGTFVLNVRTQATPASLLEPVRKILASLDPTLAFVEVHTLAEEVDASTAGDRLAAGLATSFAALAALLAGVGIYGLLAYAVTQRSREIGIRMAVGADGRDVAGLLWRQTLTMAGCGVALGIGGVFWVSPWVRSLLYEVSPRDPISLAMAGLVVAALASLSTAVPVRKAIRIDPAVVLHE